MEDHQLLFGTRLVKLMLNSPGSVVTPEIHVNPTFPMSEGELVRDFCAICTAEVRIVCLSKGCYL
jgi:hypothetical protein